MSAPAMETVSELQSLRRQAGMAQEVVRRNVDGLSHEDSLVRPQPGGNCLNWIMGHLVWTYAGALRLLGQEPVVEQEGLKHYARGAPPLGSPAEAWDFGKLLAAWNEEAVRVDAGLSALSPEALGRPAPFSPSGDPDETVRSLLYTILFHQAYHAGQTAVLRRIIGRPGAIK